MLFKIEFLDKLDFWNSVIKASKAFSISHRKNCTRETFQRDEMTQKKSEVLQLSKASSPDANCASDA